MKGIFLQDKWSTSEAVVHTQERLEAHNDDATWKEVKLNTKIKRFSDRNTSIQEEFNDT